MMRPSQVEERQPRQPVEHNESINDIRCSKCAHSKVCMYKEKYEEFVSEVINIRKKYDKEILDFEIKCAEYAYNKQPISRKM